MMKYKRVIRVVLTGMISVHMILCSAQTTAEWIRQKKTRISYLMKQIAAQQVYLNDLKKGYGIVSGGLGVITDIKHGDFDLHRNYFSSLSDINSGVKETGKAKSISDIQTQILGINKAIRAGLSSPFLHPDEAHYITATLNGLLKKCDVDIDKLTVLITPGESVMTDAKRLTSLNDLYDAAQQHYTFVMHFRNSIQQLIASRTREQGDVSTMNSIYGIKQNR